MKTKVLILIDWFLPGNKAGGPVKSIYSLVKSLENDIDFFILTMNTDINSDKEYNVTSDKWTKYDGINVFYFSERNFTIKNFLNVVHQLNPDVIYINSFWSYKFSILPLLLSKFLLIKSPIVLSPRGMLESGAMGIKSFKKKLFLFISKTIGLHKNLIFHATSDNEKKSIEYFYPSSKIFQIPNLSYIQSIESFNDKKENHLKLFFLSRVSPVKNLDFAIDVLKEVSNQKYIFIEYDIYGNNEDKEYFKLCKELIKSLPENIKVTYKGTLSFNEISATIQNYHFLFLPTKNENFGHAIVETLFCGRPVIISNCTPWNDVNVFNCGYALPLDKNKFAEKILYACKMNTDEFQKMCINAKNYIQKKINIDQIKNEYKKLFEYVAKSK
ncbi:MAG TPA: glycosyltransferase [Bacteroidia bacterium]|nr:glycosyltransferase [Bacteroidia bacterium]